MRYSVVVQTTTIKEIYVDANSVEEAKTKAVDGMNSFRLMDINTDVLSVVDPKGNAEIFHHP